MAGLKVVPVKSLADGSLDLVDLKEKAEKHKDNLAALMVRADQTPLFHGLMYGRRSLIRPHLAFSRMVYSTYVTVPIVFLFFVSDYWSISSVGMSSYP